MKLDSTKYIFVTGGVCSSLGKGVSTASIGLILKSMGYRVNIVKIDPYLNVDAGTMSPYQHGEVFVTFDGGETDLDLGTYERFLNQKMYKTSSITAGKVYKNVIEKERRGDYLGQTVQVIPHVTNEIKDLIKLAEKVENEEVDILLVEIGGTVGDIESVPFIEAIRQFSLEIGKRNTLFIHVTLLPYLSSSDEIKTKPTQHSVAKLRELGIQPDIIICRSEKDFSKNETKKIALFTNVEERAVIKSLNMSTIYEVPLSYIEQELDKTICSILGIPHKTPEISLLQRKVEIFKSLEEEITIAVVGKYVSLRDSYKSIYESLFHAGIENKVKIKTTNIESDKISETEIVDVLSKADGIIVPGGFGKRGIEGKINSIKFARENNVPFLGICLGMQLMSIEFARNVCGLTDANSLEFETKTSHPVISLLDEQKRIIAKGGTMRLGAQKILIKKNTTAYQAYKQEEVYERHRHRYEFNPEYIPSFEENGIVFSGFSETGLVEIIENTSNRFMVGVQFHPEFQSSIFSPNPIFNSFIKAITETL
ncbi:MAG: CTP synthase [Brevinematales bacterium]|nr:CTP synthase [Brevinematales bacterium]